MQKSTRILLFLLFVSFSTQPLWANADSSNESTPNNIQIQWGGYIKTQETESWPDDQSILQPVGTGSYFDNATEFRLNNKILFSDRGYFETHYEAAIPQGDTRRKLRELERINPALFKNGFPGALNDDRRLMNLTATVHEDDNYRLTQRLDRLALTLQPQWGTVRLGRQALTWGNGLLFNPMDLFNPFAPTDIIRYYKVGDDMLTTQISLENIGDIQFLYVPRRNPANHDVEWSQSSLAGKLHFAAGTNEFDLMGGIHHDDMVIGFGSTGYIKDAAWRLDATWTFINNKTAGADNFLCLVANVDYSWVWWEKNFYGLVEFYFNGLGSNDYPAASTNPLIIDRINRGEMFTLGRTYLATTVRMELHPLLNFSLTAINNLNGPSGIIQPRIIWDVTQNVQFVIGGGFNYGSHGTEFGGFEIPQSTFLNKPSDRIFTWLTWFY